MTFDPYTVPRGTKEFGYVPVVNNLLVDAKVPVGVVNGVEDGPTLAVTGGLYPTEYCGVESASRLYQLIDPAKLRGRFITIPVMNMPAFQFKLRWLNLKSTGSSPFDGVGINNVFPGNPEGKLTERIAHVNYGILSKADYHVDFRGGDFPESHLVHTIQLRVGDRIDETTAAMAKAFGLEYVLPGTPEIGHTSPGTMIHSLCTSGVASIISESGLGYRTQPLEEFVEDHIRGTVNLLKHFGMMDGAPVRPAKQDYLDMDWCGVPTPEAGVFTALADYGDILREGQVIGRITDIDGSLISEVKSPIDGVVHTMYPARLVFPGDNLYTLLKVGGPTGW